MKDDSIRLLKLVTNESIVCEIISEHPSFFLIKRPLKVLVIPRKDDEGFNLAILRWDLLLDFDEPVSLNKFSLISISILTEEIKLAYTDAIKKYDTIMSDNESEEHDKLEKEVDQFMNLMSLRSNKNIH